MSPALTNTVLALDPSCVGWWKFDETSGTTVADSSPNGNHGTIQGTVQWVGGRVDGALCFDGTTTYVLLSTATGAVIRSLTDCTMGIWARWTGAIETSNSQRIFDFGSSGSSYMYLQPSTNAGGALRFVIRSSLGGAEELVTAANALDNAWHHVVLTIDSTSNTMTLYLDGAASGTTTMVANRLSYMGTTFYHYVGCSAGDPPYFTGYLDDFYIFNRVLSPAEIVKLQLGGALGRDLASKPSPADKETDVSRDVVLRWAAGISAATHNVYLGSDSDAVKNAGMGSPLLVSPGQTATSYAAGRLEFGRTYYWRVDEVDATANHAVFKGEVWSFTVESYASAIPATSIAATASSYVTGRGPEKTIDGSGLNATDGHSTVLTDMWQTAKGTTLPAWIQYKFDKVCKLSKMLVWNYNGESFLAIQGAKDVVVEHSMDGKAWTQLAGVTEFPMATGAAGHTSDITVDFGDVPAMYVKITIKSNWSGGMYSQCGLSEVRLTALPVTAANPSPASGAKDVALDTTLSWKPGREAAQHKIYLSTDQQAVASGTAAAVTGQQASYSPSLVLGGTYFWRVDEVNAAQTPSTWAGAVWSFTTTGFIVVDDMESYDDADKAIYKIWIDGYGTANNGCQVGNDVAPFANRTTVHGGWQSMPFRYVNSGAAAFSEATRTFTTAQDWTVFGIKTLTLFFYGDASNTAASLYVKINGTKISYTGDAANVSKAQWTQWDIPLSAVPAFAQRSVTTLTIGAATGSGNLLIDDIRLY